MMEWIMKPWPWYVAGPLIGLVVPVLLLAGNKSFGISSSLRHICAACIPAGIPFFKYEWRKEAWNLFFVAGIAAGGYLAVHWIGGGGPVQVHPALVAKLATYGITDYTALVPGDIISWHALRSFRGILLMAGGGFLVGFGTRYAGGCTSGHAIMGLATLQWPSLVATICFMAGGFLATHFLLPLVLSL